MLDGDRPLRVGALVESASAPMWILAVLKDIDASSFLRLGTVGVLDSPNSQVLWPDRWRKLTWSWYSAVDRVRHRKDPDAFRRGSISGHLPNARLLPLSMREGPNSVPLGFDDQLDVIIDFSGTVPPGLVHVPRFGIWVPSIGDRHRGAEPPLVSEVFRGARMTEIRLEVFKEGAERAVVVEHSFCAVEFASPFRNANAIYWRTAGFIIRGLRDLHRHGWTELERRATLLESTEGRTNSTERSITPARFIARATTARLMRTASSWTRRTQWRIGVRPRTWKTLADRSDEGFQFLSPGNDGFHADPFLVQNGSRNYVFFEDYRYVAKKAVISYVELGERGEFGEPEVALRADHHLSYPFLFKFQGSIFLIPESVASRRVELYRAAEFPRRWTLEATLLKDVHLADPTLFEADGKFWMFGASSVLGGLDWSELYLYFASDILGPWHAHPNNPVVADVRRARPAGRLFWDGGRLIRPGQDCSRGYGYAIALNQVELLSEHDYAESIVGGITPARLPGTIGVHTLNHNDNFEVIDARFVLRTSIAAMSARARRGLRRTVRLG